MTVGTKIHQTLASLEAATAEMKTFALETEDKAAKQMFSQFAQQLDSICHGLSARVNYIEQQEPQYKVFNNAIQQGNQQNAQQNKMNQTKLQ
ncbi:MAG: DUF1657 domain-containing protein [Peptococcaceae bacterium]|jgi:hypothetical protein|nr:DUF1657 domain-containing protein [Peptococcaceae bacterium]MDH7525545.1 DUF1657 domain-containing protein [Peptococcaceae bacterium]